MRKFILILSDTDERRLAHTFPKVLAGLRLASPKVLPLLFYHIVLFESDGDLEAARRIVQSILEASDHWLVFEIHPSFLGVLDFGRMEEVNRFFGS